MLASLVVLLFRPGVTHFVSGEVKLTLAKKSISENVLVFALLISTLSPLCDITNCSVEEVEEVEFIEVKILLVDDVPFIVNSELLEIDVFPIVNSPDKFTTSDASTLTTFCEHPVANETPRPISFNE